MTTMAVGNRRLLRLATILDTADAKHKAKKEPKYCQDYFVHPCDTPACALGHYAAATPKRWEINGTGSPRLRRGSSYSAVEDAMREFAITEAEWSLLFGGDGCGDAKTAKEAAAYIREFVKRRQKGA